MALIRCPGCRNDTSDSLANCPNCGASLHGSGPGLFDRGAASADAASAPIATEPMGGSWPTASPTLDPGSRAAQAASLGTKLKAAAFVVVLFVLAFVPHSLPIVIVLAVFWLMMNRNRAGSGKQRNQVEALRIFVNEVRKTRSTVSSGGRPLERMRKLEEEIRSRRQA